MKHKTKIAIDTVFFNRPYSGITRVWETILQNISAYITNDSINNDSINNDSNYEIILLIRGVMPHILKYQKYQKECVLERKF